MGTKRRPKLIGTQATSTECDDSRLSFDVQAYALFSAGWWGALHSNRAKLVRITVSNGVECHAVASATISGASARLNRDRAAI
jgi:hypothetical protein